MYKNAKPDNMYNYSKRKTTTRIVLKINKQKSNMTNTNQRQQLNNRSEQSIRLQFCKYKDNVISKKISFYA